MIARAPRENGGMLPPRDMALAVLVASIWGVSFIAIKAGVAEAPPLFLTALRFFLAAFPAVLLVPRPKAKLVISLAMACASGSANSACCSPPSNSACRQGSPRW